MHRGRFTGLALLVLAASMLVPSAAGHAAPEPLDNEIHVLADEASDEFYWYDGYDLYHTHVREAHWERLDQTGIVFRFTLYGGFAPGNASDALHVDIQATGPDGPQTVRFTTTDDRNWTSEAGSVLFADITEDEPPYTGVTARMQVLVPYEVFGVERGDSLEAITLYSYADEDLRDKSPGGIYVPMSGGEGEAPQESNRLVDPLELAGPSGYVNVSVQTQGTGATFDVENALSNGQHVAVETEPTPGWNVSYGGFSQASLDAGDAVSFQLNATTSPNATEPLPVHLVTDLGGYRTYYLGVNGTTLSTGLEPASVDVAPEQPARESPGLAGGTIAVVLGLLALTAAHQRRDA